MSFLLHLGWLFWMWCVYHYEQEQHSKYWLVRYFRRAMHKINVVDIDWLVVFQEWKNMRDAYPSLGLTFVFTCDMIVFYFVSLFIWIVDFLFHHSILVYYTTHLDNHL
jgi:hypothetical protein